MWVRIKGILGQQASEADTGIATFRAMNGKMVSISKGKREVLEEHYRSWENPQPTKRLTQNSTRKSTRGQRRTQVLQKGKTVVQPGYRESSQAKK